MIADLYELREYGKALRLIMLGAERSTSNIDEAQLAGESPNSPSERVNYIGDTLALNAFLNLTIVQLVLLKMAEQVEYFSNASADLGDSGGICCEDTHLSTISPHASILEDDRSHGGCQQTEPRPTPAPARTRHAEAQAHAAQPQGGVRRLSTISIEDFAKIDLRIVRIVNADNAQVLDKLLRLTLDRDLLGHPAGVGRDQVPAYAPEALVDATP